MRDNAGPVVADHILSVTRASGKEIFYFDLSDEDTVEAFSVDERFDFIRNEEDQL